MEINTRFHDIVIFCKRSVYTHILMWGFPGVELMVQQGEMFSPGNIEDGPKGQCASGSGSGSHCEPQL